MGTESRELPNTRQTAFLFTEEGGDPAPGPPKEAAVQFLRRDSNELFVGAERLRSYLERNSLGHVVQLKERIDRIDTSAMEQQYKGVGRPPYHPKVILGLVFYGFTEGKTSLRDLERLAVCDVGAWWICGGLQPDHATIGRTILRHQDQITEAFFVQVTEQIVKELNLKPHQVAGDGTVTEAAASHYKTMRREAAEAYAKSLRERADASKDAGLEQRAQQAEEAVKALEQRQDQRKSKGRDPSTVQVSPTEPEAVVQRRKDGATRPAYKPSIMADETRLILAAYVTASSEVEAVGPMVEQCTAILGTMPTTLLDAGYCTEQVLWLALESDIDLLCPSGRLDKTGNAVKASRQGKLVKTDFLYDEDLDVYTCPQGQSLAPCKASLDRHGSPVVVYQAEASACASCPQRALCTDSPNGRTIRRYHGDELKEAMQQVMAHPQARRLYVRRQVMVEPVFAQLHRQGLRRFHRRGQKKVRLEFILHCLAYNLGRAARLHVLGLYARRQGGSWRLLAAWIQIIAP